MSIGACIDKTMADTVAVLEAPGALINTAAFVNPEATLIANLIAGGATPQAAILALLVEDPLSHLWPANTVDLVSLYNLLSDFCGGHHISFTGSAIVTGATVPYPMMGQYHVLTEFLSGKAQVFPIAGLDPGLGITNIAFLGTMSFAAMLGVAAGGRMAENTLCQTDPNDPCRVINGIFGAVLGAFDAVLNAILAGFAVMTDFITMLATYIANMVAAIAAVLQFIQDTINALLNALFSAIRLGLAKLLNSLDPCLRLVVSNIAGPALQAAIGI